MAVVTMKQLLEAGVHFGHQTRRWNPKMNQYIYTSRGGIHVIDLQKTVVKFEEAYEKMLEIAQKGGKVLFVGTKKQARDVVKEEAEKSGQYYVSQRWLGGTLTNFKTIRKSIRKLHDFYRQEKDGTFSRLTKKEVILRKKEMARLEKFLGGIKEMKTLPEAVFVVDPLYDLNAVKEAKKLNIPVFGISDTNCDPDLLDVFIPANDDAIRSIKLIVGKMAEAFMVANAGDAGDVSKEQEAPKKVQKTEEAPVNKVKEQTKEAPSKVAEPAEEKPVKEEKTEENVDLISMTVKELRELAKAKGLTGYSKLKKAELIDALK